MCADANLNAIRVHAVGVEGDVAISVRDVNKETLSETDPRAAAEHEEKAPLLALQIAAERDAHRRELPRQIGRASCRERV